MKIALVSSPAIETPPLSYGGEIVWWDLAKELAKLGHEVYLFGKVGSKCPPNGKLFYYMSISNGADPQAEFQLIKDYIDAFNECDIIHDCSLDGRVGTWLSQIYKKKNIIWSINGNFPFVIQPVTERIIALSKFMQKKIKNWTSIDVPYVHYGVDEEFYKPNGVREDWFLWISRFHPDKGIDEVIDWAEMLGFELKISGSLEMPDHLIYGAKVLDRIRTIPNIHFVKLPLNSKHHEMKRELYRKAKAFLFPLHYEEAFGLVVAEAMACGCPVVAYSRGSMAELIEDGKNGFLCETKKDFHDAIMKILNGYEFEKLPTIFSAKKMAKEYVKIYENIVN